MTMREGVKINPTPVVFVDYGDIDLMGAEL
jgi:hypothetical protein